MNDQQLFVERAAFEKWYKDFYKGEGNRSIEWSEIGFIDHTTQAQFVSFCAALAQREPENTEGDWVLVPKEPTRRMLNAAKTSTYGWPRNPQGRTAKLQSMELHDKKMWQRYRAMLAAAPSRVAKQKAIGPREPVVEGEVVQVCAALRKGQALRGGGAHMAIYIADLLERTEAARLAAERVLSMEEMKSAGFKFERDELQDQLSAECARSDGLIDLLAYVFQDDLHNRLTYRVIDIAYTAFMHAKQPNTEDGGPSDWFNDTKPIVVELIAKLRKDLFEGHAAYQSSKENEK